MQYKHNFKEIKIKYTNTLFYIHFFWDEIIVLLNMNEYSFLYIDKSDQNPNK